MFASPESADRVVDSLEALVNAGDVGWLAGTAMPDHVHALFELGHRLSLDRVVAKFKGGVARSSRSTAVPVVWQENVFEHRLRDEEGAESYAFYVFMNPYRDQLCGLVEPWPWWICTCPERFRFLGLCRENGSPQPEWLREADRIAKEISHGE